jgi:endoglucanase
MNIFSKGLFFCLLVFVIACSKDLTKISNKTHAITTNEGFVKANRKRLYQGNNEVLLKGVGLGGWMLQEGYMLGTSGPQNEIRSKLESLAGQAATEQFYANWLNTFVTESDVKQIADWGYNSIRLPMHYNLYFDASGNWVENSTGLKLTDDLLKWCKSNNLMLILDLHAAPGGQGNNKDISDRKEGFSLWTDPKFQDMTVLMWAKLAEKYKEEKSIAGFDLLNEINYDFEATGNAKGCSCQVNAPLLNLYKRIIDAVRKVDKNHLLILEGNCYGNNYKGLESLITYDPNRNIALSFHSYWSRNDDKSIKDILGLRDKYNVPIWQGETGENSNTWFNEKALHLKQQSIGWANWPWKKINNLDGPVIVKPIQEWNKIVNYWSNPSNPKPTTQEAQKALTKFVESLKLENCILMNGVSYAYLDKPASAFSPHTIPGKIYMAEYDEGKINVSWNDVDYQNTSGSSSNTIWNKGVEFRNDGVDIYKNDDSVSGNGYYVGSITGGEWLKFSLASVVNGIYDIQLRIRQKQTSPAKIILEINDVVISSSQIPTEGNNWVNFTIKNIPISSGNSLKLRFENGGFDLSSLDFIKK